MRPLESTIEGLRKQRAALLAEVEIFDEAIASLEKIVGRASSTNEPIRIIAPTKTRRTGPGTTAAIVTILTAADRPMNDIEILEAMDQRGWTPPSRTPLNALRASLSRLRRMSPPKIVRDQDGAYRLPEKSEAPSEPRASDHVSNQGGRMDPP